MGAIGLFKALDLQVVDYQSGQDLLGVWDPASGGFRAGFPATVNDLQLLTGPAVADIDGQDGEEVLTGSSSQDLVAYGPFIEFLEAVFDACRITASAEAQFKAFQRKHHPPRSGDEVMEKTPQKT